MRAGQHPRTAERLRGDVRAERKNSIAGSSLPYIAAASTDAALARGAVKPAVTARRLADLAQAVITAAVADANGNLPLAARKLGISRSTLYVKLAAMRA